jgi:hypothetical protein
LADAAVDIISWLVDDTAEPSKASSKYSAGVLLDNSDANVLRVLLLRTLNVLVESEEFRNMAYSLGLLPVLIRIAGV